MTDPNVLSSASQLKKVIEISLDPSSSKESREDAIKFQLEFMEKSDLCGIVGLYLYNQESHPALRTCGLDMVCHYIKNKWYSVPPNNQEDIKKEVIDIVKKNKITEPYFIKEGVVKLFVEVVKRTWPQEWASLFSDLNGLQSYGDAQLELVLKIFKVISEDVNGMDDKIKAQRRKDMLQTLNSHMGGLFEFFQNTLVNKALELQKEKTKENLSIAHGAITTITTYASWVKFEYLLSRELELLKTLILLLETDHLKYSACDCLSTIFERKGEPEERSKMMVLLSEDALEVIIRVTRSIYESAGTDESEYLCLKRLVEAITLFGTNQIANLWGEDKGFRKEPKGFSIFLNIILDLYTIDSMLIDTMILKCLSVLMSNVKVASTKTGQAIIPRLLDAIIVKLTKDTNPFVKDASDESVYNSYDFCDVNEFNEMLGSNRNALSNLFDVLLKIKPEEVFYHGLQQINCAVQTPPPSITGDGDDDEVHLESKYYRSWDALCFYIKQTVYGLFSVYPTSSTEQMTIDCNQSLNKLLHYYKCVPAVFRLPLLKTMECLFLVFKSQQNLLMDTMSMLFDLITQPIGEEKKKCEIKLQRFACLCFNSICKTVPYVLGEIFTDLEALVYGLLDENYLTNHQKGLLIQGILRVCVVLDDKAKQVSFITKILSFIQTTFKKLQGPIKDSLQLINLIGINDGKRIEEMDKDLSQFLLALNCFYSITKTCKVVKNIDSIEDDPSNDYLENTVTQYPWVQPLINLLPDIFDIVQQYSLMLQTPNRISPCIRKSFQNNAVVTECENEEEKNRFERALHSLISIYELVYSGLSECPKCLGPILYSLTGFSDVIVDKVVLSWNNLPSFKLLKIWRVFLPAFSRACPKKYRETTLTPVLSSAIYHTFERLNNEWKKVKESGTNMPKLQSKNGEEKEEDGESEEIKYLRNLCKLSDEFISVICDLCSYKRLGEKKESEKINENSTVQIGELGTFLLMCEKTNLLIIQALFTSFTWPYTGFTGKVCLCINSIVPKIFQPQQKINPELANQLLIFLLQGLEQYGYCESAMYNLFNSIMRYYLYMRLQYPGIVNIMMMIPTCTEESLKEFDLEYLTDEEPLTDSKKKRQRNQFKKLVEGACGKSLSVLYQDDTVIKDLPKLPKRSKQDQSVFSNDPEVIGLTQLFGN